MKKSTLSFNAPTAMALLPALLMLLIFSFLLPVLALAATVQDDAVDLAWSKFDGQRFEIFYTTRHNKKWGERIQITNDQYNNMHPSLAAAGKGKVWLVWTALNGKHNKLFYARKSNGQWSYPKEIETGLQSSIAPAIVIGPGGRPWITWAGYNGKNDDIYVSRWNGLEWSKPERIHPANNVPDILPAISIVHGKPAVTWQQYDGDKYVYLSSTWNGSTWSAPQPEPAVRKQIREKNLKKKQDFQAQLPLDIHPVGNPALLFQ